MTVAPRIDPVRTTCPYCGVGCGLIVQPDGRGGAAVAGDPTHPANFGKTWPKGRPAFCREVRAPNCTSGCDNSKRTSSSPE